MDFYGLDREVSFQDKQYKVVAVLDRQLLLVVEKKLFDDGVFPIPTLIIPGE